MYSMALVMLESNEINVNSRLLDQTQSDMREGAETHKIQKLTT